MYTCNLPVTISCPQGSLETDSLSISSRQIQRYFFLPSDKSAFSIISDPSEVILYLPSIRREKIYIIIHLIKYIIKIIQRTK